MHCLLLWLVDWLAAWLYHTLTICRTNLCTGWWIGWLSQYAIRTLYKHVISTFFTSLDCFKYSHLFEKNVLCFFVWLMICLVYSNWLPLPAGFTKNHPKVFPRLGGWYCWWKKCCTSWQVVYPIIYRIFFTSQVQDFFHQQYQWPGGGCQSRIYLDVFQSRSSFGKARAFRKEQRWWLWRVG